MDIAILVILVLIFILQLLPFILSLKAPKEPIKQLNFENDILFLNYLINVEITNYTNYVITAAKAAGRRLMTDDEVNNVKEEMITQVYSHLSLNYKMNLYKYFNEEGLNYYICNTIINELNKTVLNYNRQFFNRTNGEKDDITVRQTDL